MDDPQTLTMVFGQREHGPSAPLEKWVRPLANVICGSRGLSGFIQHEECLALPRHPRSGVTGQHPRKHRTERYVCPSNWRGFCTNPIGRRAFFRVISGVPVARTSHPCGGCRLDPWGDSGSPNPWIGCAREYNSVSRSPIGRRPGGARLPLVRFGARGSRREPDRIARQGHRPHRPERIG